MWGGGWVVQRGARLQVVRSGAISIEELRVVVPAILDLGQDDSGQGA